MENENTVASDEGSKELSSILTSNDIPALVGQVATLVINHYKEQIAKLMSDNVELKLDITTLKAQMLKEIKFTEDLHRIIYDHRHTEVAP